jgi:hypothetical protein
MSKFEPEVSPSPSPEQSPASSESSSSNDEMDISADSDAESGSSVGKVDTVSRAQQKTPAATTNSADDLLVNEDLSSEVLIASKDGEDDEDLMDLESSNASSKAYTPEPAVALVSASASSSMPQSQDQTSRPNLADELAPELQPSAEQQSGAPNAVSTNEWCPA